MNSTIERVKPRAQPAPRFKSMSAEYGPWCLFIAAYTLLAIGVGAFGNYPQSDDAWFGPPVFAFLQTGQIHFPTWASMTLIAQLAWGSLFCALLGPSFTALRISTFVLSVTGLYFIYLTAREVGAGRQAAYLTMLAVCLNPIYFCLTFSFLTDVPYFAATAVANYFWLRSLKANTSMRSLGMSLFCVLATLTRQCGLCMPAAWLLTQILRGPRKLKSIALAAIPLSIAAGALLLFEHWMHTSGQQGPHTAYQSSAWFLVKSQWHITIAQTLVRLVKIPFYCGFFLCPIGMSLFFGFWRHSRKIFAAIGAFSLLSSIAITVCYSPMPFLAGMFIPTGFGPLSIAADLQQIPGSIRFALTLVSALSITSMVCEGIARAKSGAWQTRYEQSLLTFALIYSAIYTLPILHEPGFYDRYMLPLTIPCIVIGLSQISNQRLNFRAGWATAMAIGFLTMMCAITYYSFSSARWELIRTAVKLGIPRQRVAGGFECRGLYRTKFNPSLHLAVVTATKDDVPGFQRAMSLTYAHPFQECSPLSLWVRPGITPKTQ